MSINLGPDYSPEALAAQLTTAQIQELLEYLKKNYGAKSAS